MRIRAAALAVLLSAAPAAGQGIGGLLDLQFDLGLDGPCYPAAEERLRRGGYDPAALRRILDIPLYDSAGGAREWQVWAYPERCDGAVVMQFQSGPSGDEEACRLVTWFTRGACTFPAQDARR